MTNKEFYSSISDEILNNCKDEADFIKAHKLIVDHMKSHDDKPEDMEYYFSSGASEMLTMATQRYRRKGK